MDTGKTEALCPIVAHERVGAGLYLMKLADEAISHHAQPGHFVMVSVSDGSHPLLKRPLGILKVEPPFFWLLYEVVGEGTGLLARRQPGDQVRVLGPLGGPLPSFVERDLLVVAGGSGIVPVYYAMEVMAPQNRVSLVYGARTREHLVLRDWIDALPLMARVYRTDDGSCGARGRVTEDVPRLLEERGITVTLSCGPEPMFHALWPQLRDRGLENYVSLEARMGCGFGVCHSCVVEGARGHYRKVCTDGPVFRMEDIAWPT